MGRASGFRTDAARAAYCALYDEAVAASPVPVEEHDVPTSFGATHVLSAGDEQAPPVVALHAKSFGATMWLPLLPALVDGHRVHLVDAVGDLGKSVATQVLSSPPRIVAWLDEVLDALGVERCALVGASIGTWMAVHYAMARPERVERLAMVCPAGIVSRQHVRWLLGSMRSVLPRPHRGRLQALVESMAMPATRPRLEDDPWRPIAAQFVVGMAGFRWNPREPRPVLCKLDRLASAGMPVLALVGRHETLHDGAAMGERLRAALPHAEVEVVDDANHLLFIDRTELVAERLRRFLAP